MDWLRSEYHSAGLPNRQANRYPRSGIETRPQGRSAARQLHTTQDLDRMWTIPDIRHGRKAYSRTH